LGADSGKYIGLLINYFSQQWRKYGYTSHHAVDHVFAHLVDSCYKLVEIQKLGTFADKFKQFFIILGRDMSTTTPTEDQHSRHWKHSLELLVFDIILPFDPPLEKIGTRSKHCRLIV